ncbi:MAG: glycosyltransferase [Paludibacter sp.]
MIKVLFISQWYPHRYDPMFGLFVQKHAEAASIYANVATLYVHPDTTIIKSEVQITSEKGFQEIRIYFPAGGNSFIASVRKQINYLKAYLQGFGLLYESWGMPEIIHSNVLTRTGVIALIFKYLYKTPYVITEHWTRYLTNSFSYTGFLRKFITQIVVKNAEAVLPVSETLKSALLANNLQNPNYIIVNNVVDTCFFEISPHLKRTKKRIIHISCFNQQQKNIKGILRSASALSQLRDDFELILIGTGIDFDDIHDYANSLNFNLGVVQFLGEKTSLEVVDYLQNSDFFVLFSNFETAGVVIAESLVCGKPVLSTYVGAAPEYINKNNGLIIPIGDEEALFNGMNFLLDNFKKYNSEEIKREAKGKFCYEKVGYELNEIYKKSLTNKTIR